MSLAKFVGRRPVTGTMFYTAVGLMGVISWFFTPRELFPSISFPQLLVITRYGNAAPEEIENLITKTIEESVGTVANLKRVRSMSKEGISLVTLEFNWGTDMGFAHLAAREKLDQIKDRLPSEAEDPIINRVNPFAQPMMIYSVSGKQDLRQLTELSKQVVKQRLEKVSGVASATISGGEEREILVQVDRPRMESQNISLTQIADTLKDSNLNYPAGTVPGKFYEYIISTKGEFKNIGDIRRLPVKVDRAEDHENKRRDPEKDWDREHLAKEHRMVRLDGVAEVVDTLKEKTSFSRYNGKETVSISIQKQADANALSTAARVRFAMEELATVLDPKGVKLELVYDESKFIREAINGVAFDGLLGGVLAFLVLYYFLKSWSMATIVALAIPASTLLTFTGMFLNKISINMLSLAGLGLGIGNMVDNSIVVAENIARHKSELGKDALASAVDGTDEVAPSMITSSLTNVAVLLPLLFAKGVAQLVFRDMFFIVTCASFASVFISITLVPLMTAHPLSFAFLQRVLLRRRGDGVSIENRFAQALARGWRWFTSGMSEEALKTLMDRYHRGLEWVLDHPKSTAQLIVVLGGVSLGLLAFQDKVFMPKIDQGQFILKLQMPVGTRLEKTNEVALKVESVLRTVPGFLESTVNVGSNNSDAVDALGNHQAQAIVNLDRDVTTTDEFIGSLRVALEKEDLMGGEIQYILQDSVLSAAFETSSPVVVELKGPDMVTLKKMSEDVLRDISGIKGIYGAKSSLALPTTETRVEVDKVSAASYQLSVAEIARTALIGIKGHVSTTFKEGGQEVDVRVQLRPEDRRSLEDIRRLTVQNRDGMAIPLSELANLVTAQGPSEIKHLDQQRAIVLSANISKRSTRDVMEDVHRALDPYRQFTEYQVDLTGESRQMKESFGGLLIAMILAAALVYMIMAAEFESLWHPFLIMVTIPFSVIGVALSLFATHTPVSAPVFLGMILLVGSVVNYGIILIDFMNQLRREGEPLRSAVIDGCTVRLRPVLMSALTTILAVLPLALGLSEGGELSSPMAVVTFGGLGVSVLLSLFVLPLIYYHSEQWREKRAASLSTERSPSVPVPESE